MDTPIIVAIFIGLVVVLLAFISGLWVGAKDGRKQARADWLITGTVPESTHEEPTIADLRYAIEVASNGIRRRQGDTKHEPTVKPGTLWRYRHDGTERVVKVVAVVRAYKGYRVTFEGISLIDEKKIVEQEVLSTFLRRAERIGGDDGLRNSLSNALGNSHRNPLN